MPPRCWGRLSSSDDECVIEAQAPAGAYYAQVFAREAFIGTEYQLIVEAVTDGDGCR